MCVCVCVDFEALCPKPVTRYPSRSSTLYKALRPKTVHPILDPICCSPRGKDDPIHFVAVSFWAMGPCDCCFEEQGLNKGHACRL